MGELTHPLFARYYQWMSPHAERAGASGHRQEMVAGLRGRVIEVGAGNGLNFGQYPATVTEVVAIEPEPYLRARARQAATVAPVPVAVVDGRAERLDVATGAFDAGVASLVLCTVADPALALQELRRVIRPGGELRFYEHVRAQPGPLARLQDRADLIWPHLGGGCHPNRESEAAIVAAGFVIERCRRFRFRSCLLSAPVAPVIVGSARRP